MKDKIEKTTLEEVVVKEETTAQEEKQKIEILKSFKDLGQVFEVRQKIEITKKQKDYFLTRQAQGFVKFI